MKTTVFITASMLDTADLDEIKRAPYAVNTELELLEEHGLLSESILRFFFALAPNIGYNAAYDLIKHSILAVLAKVNGKRKENEEDGTKLVIEVCKKDSNGKFGDRKVVTVSTSYKMSEDERERTISKMVEYSLYEDQE